MEGVLVRLMALVNTRMQTIPLPKKSLTKLQELAGLALEHFPIKVSISDLSPGRKAYFDIPLKENPKDLMTDFLHIYVESKLTKQPKDSYGFTVDDVTESTGVMVFKKTNDGVPVGEIFSLESLLNDLVSDLSLRNRILFRVQEMRRLIHLDDDFLAFANDEWTNRTSDESFGFGRLN